MTAVVQHKRLAFLESARGIASIIVVLHHFVLGFLSELKAPLLSGGLKNTPLYMFINGSGAVAFFFMLSGFVLTRKFYGEFSWPDLWVSVLKRLPRLALPAGISFVMGLSVLRYLPGAHMAASALTGSDWLASFAGANFPSNFTASFSSAFRDSLLVFILPRHFQYNSNLWTMFYEFYGSIAVFMIALCAVVVLHRSCRKVVLLHVFAGVACLANIFFLPFVIGSLISFLHSRHGGGLRLPVWLRVLLVALVLKGFSVDNLNLVIIGSTAAMLLLLGLPALERILGNSFGLFLGRLSFPLYLVHVLVILSFTSYSYVFLSKFGADRYVGVAICFLITWACSLCLALPLMALERVWIPLTDRVVRVAVSSLMASSGRTK